MRRETLSQLSSRNKAYRDQDELTAIDVGPASASSLPAHAERRLVELAGYIIRADRKIIIDVKVIDLSYDGCAVHTTVPLVPGETVKLSVLGRSATAVVVRWYAGRKAGLQFETEQKSRTYWPRSAERMGVQTQALLRRAGRVTFPVRLFDITMSGCRCEFVDRPGIHERVWMKLNGLASLEANVCWVEQSMLELSFATAVHPAVFEMVMDRLRPL